MNQNNHWIVFCVLFSSMTAGCVSNSKRDYNFIRVPKHINTDINKLLSVKELEYDKEQLLYTLRNAYSGRFLPGNQYKILLKDIKSIQAPIDTKKLCETLNNHFNKVSDQHLEAAPCVKEKRTGNGLKEKGNVGGNYYKKMYHKQKNPVPWNVKLDKKNGHTALLISIMHFPLEASPLWTGFLDKVKKLLPHAKLVIIDLRGATGGDNRTGYKLSNLLAGARLKSPYKKQKTIDHPVSFQIMVNTMDLWARQFADKNKEIPQDIKDMKKTFVQMRDKSIKGESVSLLDVQEGELLEEVDFDYEKSIKKPIYILMDSQCPSACEGTIDYFEFNTLVKTVGENTAGMIHFGNTGKIVLKNSGIIVSISISYKQYYDGRFIEKIGITPKIQVPSSQDAMSYAWKDFLKNPYSTKK